MVEELAVGSGSGLSEVVVDRGGCCLLKWIYYFIVLKVKIKSFMLGVL